MPYNLSSLMSCESAQAGADLSTSQFFAVSLVNDTASPPDVHMVVATAAKACAGILQNNPVSGVVGTYQRTGITKAVISASSTLTAGTTMLEVDTGGTLKPVASGVVVAQAMESLTSQATTAIRSVMLLPSNALFA